MFVSYSQVVVVVVTNAWGPTVRRGTVRGQSGGRGGIVLGPAGWVSNIGSEPSSVPAPTARGAKTSWEETWSIDSVTSSLAKVSVRSQTAVFKKLTWSVLLWNNVSNFEMVSNVWMIKSFFYLYFPSNKFFPVILERYENPTAENRKENKITCCILVK